MRGPFSFHNSIATPVQVKDLVHFHCERLMGQVMRGPMGLYVTLFHLVSVYLLRVSAVDLNDPCATSNDCSSIINGHCENGRCTCFPHAVPLNASTCIAGSLLGFRCFANHQCQNRVPNSICDDGVCTCADGYVSHQRDACLAGSGLGGHCFTDSQCQLNNKLSHCKLQFRKGYGRCACLPGFQSYRNHTCGEILGAGCTSDNECRTLDPNSHCTPRDLKTSFCTCGRGYTVSADGLRCVTTYKGIFDQPSSLGKHCRNSEQCQLRDPYSICDGGICRCVEETPRCNSKNSGCHNDTFQCRSGWCLSWYYVCDGRANCDDGSDEDECIPFNCPRQAHQCGDGSCLARSKVCNGRRDCIDGSDENNCFNKCNSKSFRCGDGACLPQYAFCNAAISCRDLSDEIVSLCAGETNSCPNGTFRCSNGRCRSTAILCTGKDGCGDASDEDRL
uniref:EB domain-containing protein n=1 Tax=Strigamia maritima TaxID=126957 RepID=T1J2G9_STRMM